MKWHRAKKEIFIDGAQVNKQLEAQVIELKEALERLQNVSPEKEYITNEVEKIVYKDNDSLLEKYNIAMRELGQLKLLKQNPKIIEVPVERVVQNTVEKIVVKNVISWKYISIASVVAFGLGYVLCFIS